MSPVFIDFYKYCSELKFSEKPNYSEWIAKFCMEFSSVSNCSIGEEYDFVRSKYNL